MKPSKWSSLLLALLVAPVAARAARSAPPAPPAPAAPLAPEPPPPPAPPAAPHKDRQGERRRFRFDFDFPDFSALADEGNWEQFGDLSSELSEASRRAAEQASREVERSLRDVARQQRDVARQQRDAERELSRHGLLAQRDPRKQKGPRAWKDDGDDNDNDGDNDSDEVDGDSDHDDDASDAQKLRESVREKIRRDREGRNAPGARSATLAVKGPVLFRLRAQAADLEVVSTDKQQVTAVIDGGPSRGGIRLQQSGDRIEADFGGRRELRSGHLHLELPRGSSLDFTSLSGDATVLKLGGDVRVRTLSGEVKVSGAANVDVQTVSGDASVDGATGSVRLHTVSGSGTVGTLDASADVDFQSTSGGLTWTGGCAKGCHLTSETVSGDVRLGFDPKSSFALSYATHSGDLQDELQLQIKRAAKKKHGGAGGWMEASFGAGEGVVECDSFSGSLQLKKR